MLSETDISMMVRNNTSLVHHFVNAYLRRYHVPSMEREDLVSWGMIGLFNAARTFDPGRGYEFSTYAGRCIERQIVKGVMREWKPDTDGQVLSLDAECSAPSGDAERLVDRVAGAGDTEQEFSVSELRLSVRQAMARLSPADQDLVRRYYRDGYTFRELARALKLSPQGVNLRLKRALATMRHHLGPEVICP